MPLTSEVEWLERLKGLPAWHVPMLPTVVLAPHPDDETLGAGGLIARLRTNGVPVMAVAVTDGEGAYEDTSGLDQIRVPEQTESLARLGVSAENIHRLHIPDRNVSLYEDQLVSRLRVIVQPDMHLVAPWPMDFHPDHEAAGRAATRVAEATGCLLTFYFFWTWHRGEPGTLDGLHLLALPLTEGERTAKLHALAAHASQLSHPDDQPILSPRLLEPAQREFEVYIQP